MKKVKIGNRHHHVNVFAADEIERQREALRKIASIGASSPGVQDWELPGIIAKMEAVAREALPEGHPSHD